MEKVPRGGDETMGKEKEMNLYTNTGVSSSPGNSVDFNVDGFSRAIFYLKVANGSGTLNVKIQSKSLNDDYHDVAEFTEITGASSLQRIEVGCLDKIIRAYWTIGSSFDITIDALLFE